MKRITSRLDAPLSVLLEELGPEEVIRQLRELSERENASDCTILINEGLHVFPEHLFFGEKFVVYRGSVDLSSEDHLNKFVTDRLIDLAVFLKSRKWRRIHLVISGHAAICMQVKLAVYRITHIETVDWVFDGAGKYLELSIPLRRILSRP